MHANFEEILQQCTEKLDENIVNDLLKENDFQKILSYVTKLFNSDEYKIRVCALKLLCKALSHQLIDDHLRQSIPIFEKCLIDDVWQVRKEFTNFAVLLQHKLPTEVKCILNVGLLALCCDEKHEVCEETKVMIKDFDEEIMIWILNQLSERKFEEKKVVVWLKALKMMSLLEWPIWTSANFTKFIKSKVLHEKSDVIGNTLSTLITIVWNKNSQIIMSTFINEIQLLDKKETWDEKDQQIMDSYHAVLSNIDKQQAVSKNVLLTTNLTEVLSNTFKKGKQKEESTYKACVESLFHIIVQLSLLEKQSVEEKALLNLFILISTHLFTFENTKLKEEVLYRLSLHQFTGSVSEEKSKLIRAFVARHIHSFIMYLQPVFQKKEWRSNEWVVQTLHHHVTYVTHPHLSGKTLQSLLPSVLKLVDDYIIDNKVFGCKILHHLLKECNITEIRWYEQILFQVMKKTLAFRDAKLLEYSLPCMIQLLAVLVPEDEIFNSQMYEATLLEILSGADFSLDSQQRIVILHTITFTKPKFSLLQER